MNHVHPGHLRPLPRRLVNWYWYLAKLAKVPGLVGLCSVITNNTCTLLLPVCLVSWCLGRVAVWQAAFLLKMPANKHFKKNFDFQPNFAKNVSRWVPGASWCIYCLHIIRFQIGFWFFYWFMYLETVCTSTIISQPGTGPRQTPLRPTTYIECLFNIYHYKWVKLALRNIFLKTDPWQNYATERRVRL